ncbi:MAG: glycerate dehydrogenase [Rhodothermales bacterium]|jgi:glycerate dehydrogenase
MKMIVLDSQPFDSGDLNWDSLADQGALTIYEQTSVADSATRIADAEVVFTNKVRIGSAELDAAPNLRYIGVLATGYDVVNVTGARERGIDVCNAPAYSGASVAQSAIASLLELTNQIGSHDHAVRKGEWSGRKHFSFWLSPLTELAGKTLTIIGYGDIGSRVAKIANALGMTVIAAQLPGRTSSSADVPRLPLEAALAAADVVSLHCPLRDSTKGIINADTLALMPRGTLLVNTSRGGLVDEDAVIAALHSGQLAGFATDVLSIEPAPPSHPVLAAPNCIVTPHFGWATLESRQRLMNICAANLRNWLVGTPQNLVN